jgi:hypothetical protein
LNLIISTLAEVVNKPDLIKHADKKIFRKYVDWYTPASNEKKIPDLKEVNYICTSKENY